MDIPVNLPEFQTQRLSVAPAGLWRGPRLLLNGERVEGKKNIFSVRNDAGNDVEVRLKPAFPDPVPHLQVAGIPFELARPLLWHEYVWMGAPVVLVFGGGALGGLFGASALYVNARIFRSDRGVAAKYGLTALISATAVAAFVVIAIIVQTLIRG
jgi:hypothetical protein